MKETIKSLIYELNRASELYYNGKESFLTDSEFDYKLKQLKKLEKESGFIYSNSPSINVGAKVLSQLEKIKIIDKPMLSLDKVYSSNAIIDFLDKNKAAASIKCDGLSVRLIYKDGFLFSANTRGNGTEGNNITEHVKYFLNVPLKIPKTEDYIIDGEAIIFDSDFQLINQNKQFKNSRNTASGALNLLDMKTVEERRLSFIAWDVIKGGYSNSFISNITEAKEFGFTTTPLLILTPEEIDEERIDIINQQLINTAKKNGIPADGVVWRIDNIKIGESKGQTAHHFLNAVAWKPNDTKYKTKLKTIHWTMGRTGALTPVAEFEPINIEGTVVERASIHNLSIYNQLFHGRPYIGQEIEISKRNQIIPQIEKVYNLKSSKEEKEGNEFSIPLICPYCGAPTIQIDTNSSLILKCSNINCEGQLINRLNHFCSNKGLDIKGLSKATLQKLIEWNWINSIKDIYNLEQFKKEWQTRPGFGEKSVTKILTAIEESKNCYFWQFLAAIGIPEIGVNTAKELNKNFKTWQEFREKVNDSSYHFWKIGGFGPETDEYIKNFDYTEADLLVNKHIKFIESPIESEKNNQILKGKTIVITGKLKNYKNRNELKAQIENYGGKVVGSMSSKVDYLINNNENSKSAKNISAKNMGIPILTEEMFIKKFFDIL